IRDYKVTGVQTCALPIWNPELDAELHPLHLTTAEKRSIAAFLRCLSAPSLPGYSQAQPVRALVDSFAAGIGDPQRLHEGAAADEIGRASCRERVSIAVRG